MKIYVKNLGWVEDTDWQALLESQRVLREAFVRQTIDSMLSIGHEETAED